MSFQNLNYTKSISFITIKIIFKESVKNTPKNLEITFFDFILV